MKAYGVSQRRRRDPSGLIGRQQFLEHSIRKGSRVRRDSPYLGMPSMQNEQEEDQTMSAYVKQLECLQCSQSRSFVLHGDREQHILGQTEAVRQARGAVMTCARFGSRSLVRGWTDAAPWAANGLGRRRRRGKLLLGGIHNS